MCKIVALFLASLVYTQAALRPTHIYVNPHGSDQSDGHSSKVPVKTIPHALSLAEQDKYNGTTVYIELMQGYYDLPKTLYINRNNTIIRSYLNQQVHVTGGYRIPSNSLKPVTDHAILTRLPASASAHVRVVNLHDLNITDFGKMDGYGSYQHRQSPLEVFFNGKPLHLAQYPNKGYLDITEVPNGKDGVTFRYNSTVPQSWHGENDPWAYGFWYYAWADRAVKIKTLDGGRKTVTLEKKTPRGLRTGHLQEYLDGVSNKEGGYFKFINILSALDEPGEYYMDRSSGKLYMWVPNQSGAVKSSDMVYISMINDCVLIVPHKEGIHLEDFTLEYCRRNGLYSPHSLKTKLYKMEIRNTGSSAAVFYGDSREITISQCYIHDTCGGLSLNGGNRTTLEASGSIIENNEITRYSRVGTVGYDAVNLNGVGHVVRYNHIYDAQAGGIGISGNDMTISNNLIHHICKDTATTGAIHLAYDLTFRGNVIRDNNIHHILNLVPGSSNKGVLLEGQVSGTLVSRNSFYDNTIHVAINGGRYNVITNNVMFNPRMYCIYVDSRGYGRTLDANFMRKLHAMPYKGPVWSLRYPTLAVIDSHNASYPIGNQITKNIMHAGPTATYIHGISSVIKPKLAQYFNFSHNGLSQGSTDHYSVSHGDLRVRCNAWGWANYIHFKQPISPNSVGPAHSPVGATYLHRGRWHLVNTSYASVPCVSQGPPKEPPLPSYLPDGSDKIASRLYPVERTGCWLNVTRCKDHPASIGTYRDMYGERYHNASTNETTCFLRAHAQWQMCGSHKEETVVAIYGPTGAATLGGEGCMSAMYGCPNHGGPADGHANATFGRYQHDRNGERTHTEEGCLAHALSVWRYCGSSPNYPVTNVYLPTGSKRTAGGGCWINLKKCPRHRQIHGLFYDQYGSTNYQTDRSDFACFNRATYYWYYCGSDARYPVTATYRPNTTNMTAPQTL